MRFAIECFQIGKCLRGLRTLFVRLCAVIKRAPLLIQCGERTSQRYKCLDGRRGIERLKSVPALMQQFIKASTQRIVAQLFQHGTHGFDFFRLVPEVVFERKRVIRLHFRVAVQPCRRLCDTSETEEFAVGNRDTLAAQFAQYIVHQFVDRRRNDNGFHLGLHGVQFVQCNGRRHCAKPRVLLFVQDLQPRLAFLDIVRHHFELKTVIQRRENLFFLVAEIRNFIRCRKERN